jgi:hypothetical protein
MSEIARRPVAYVREDGFQIVHGVDQVRIEVYVGASVSTTRLCGEDMEAAMVVNWSEEAIRHGTLQFGLRNIARVFTQSEFTFRTE